MNSSIPVVPRRIPGIFSARRPIRSLRIGARNRRIPARRRSGCGRYRGVRPPDHGLTVPVSEARNDRLRAVSTLPRAVSLRFEDHFAPVLRRPRLQQPNDGPARHIKAPVECRLPFPLQSLFRFLPLPAPPVNDSRPCVIQLFHVPEHAQSILRLRFQETRRTRLQLETDLALVELVHLLQRDRYVQNPSCVLNRPCLASASASLAITGAQFRYRSPFRCRSALAAASIASGCASTDLLSTLFDHVGRPAA